MFHVYSPRRARRIIARLDPWISRLAESYPLPKACLQAILYQEITGIDWLDLPADLAVAWYWLRYRARRFLVQKGLLRRALPACTPGFLGKKDSSTGYAQIFGYVGVDALQFAKARGLPLPEGLDHVPIPGDPDDLCETWRRLRRDERFNLHLAALNLLSAAEEMTGRMEVAGASPEELQRIFTRYNANTRAITPYGKAVYQHYLAYAGAQKDGEGASVSL